MHISLKSLLLRGSIGLGTIVLLLTGLCWIFPLNDAVWIGGDDGYELSKSLLLARDPVAARLMWNDQPWLHTLLTARLFRLFGEHAAVPRLFSAFSLMALFLAMSHLFGNKLETILAALFLITAEQMAYLSLSAMVEVPALSWAMVAAALAFGRTKPPPIWRILLSGFIFAAALHIKLTAVLVLPGILLFLIFPANGASSPRSISPSHRAAGVWGVPVVGNCIHRVAAWSAAVSAAFGFFILISPAFDLDQILFTHISSRDKLQNTGVAGPVFQIAFLLENPALLLGAAAGIWLLFQKLVPEFLRNIARSPRPKRFPAVCDPESIPRAENKPQEKLPSHLWRETCPPRTMLVLLFSGSILIAASMMAIFHKPWWKFYLVHFNIPLALMAGIGTAWLLRRAFQHLKQNAPLPPTSAMNSFSPVNLSRSAEYRGGDGSSPVFQAEPLGVEDKLTPPAFRLAPRIPSRSPAAALFSAAILSLWCGFGIPVFINNLTLVYIPPRASKNELCRSMQAYSDRVRWIFTPSGAHAFHGGMTIPPELVVVSQKRVWSNAINEEEVLKIARRYTPELLLLKKRGHLDDEAWLGWVRNDYVPVAQDELNELWVHQRLEPQRIDSHDTRLATLDL